MPFRFGILPSNSSSHLDQFRLRVHAVAVGMSCEPKLLWTLENTRTLIYRTPIYFQTSLHVMICSYCCLQVLRTPRQRGTDSKRSKSLSNESQGGGHEAQRRSYRRSKSDLETTKAAQELFEVICRNGGSLSMSTALSKLSSESRQTVEYSAHSFAKRFVDFFIFKDGGITIEAIVTIRFCKVKQEKGCTNKHCPDLHLCPFHIADNYKCIYENSCKRSHDVSHVSDEHTTFVFASHGWGNLTEKER